VPLANGLLHPVCDARREGKRQRFGEKSARSSGSACSSASNAKVDHRRILGADRGDRQFTCSRRQGRSGFERSRSGRGAACTCAITPWRARRRRRALRAIAPIRRDGEGVDDRLDER
jgi:hypothetical protein